MKIAWRLMLAGLNTPNKIQPREYSIGSGLDGNRRVFRREADGNRRFAYLNRNDRDRDLNLNYLENDFNDDWRFAVVRKPSFIFLPSLPAGVFFQDYFSKPKPAGRFLPF